MRVLKNIFLIICVLMFVSPKSDCASVWINDLRTLFLSKKAIIYGVNIRTFNAKDNDKDGIIDEDLGEERGTFLNAIDRLDELVSYGVNTIHLLPVMAVGKTKAIGTAGSLYAISSFTTINPQLKSPKSNLSVNDEMRIFIEECHRRKIRVMVDMPSCGAYDLYLTNPGLFKKDKFQNPIVPSDWTDVRLLDAGTNDQINMDVYDLYSDFLDVMINMNVDGVVANVATIKPYAFWKKLIDETRLKSPQMLFLADASPLTKGITSEYAAFTPYNKLLDAGFDGYYGSDSGVQNWKKADDLFSHVKTDIDATKKYSSPKSLIGNFATHDQTSPVLINGPQFSKMIIWLNTTLPLNPYYIDGFPTGDTYIYPNANKKASKTFTDDEYYFVHRGQLDIFNFSRKPEGKYNIILQDFILANKFRNLANDVLANGNFLKLKTSSSSVFAYARSLNSSSVIVIGNLDFIKTQKVIVNVPKMNTDLISVPIKLISIPKISKGKIQTDLAPGEVQVLFFNGLNLK